MKAVVIVLIFLVSSIHASESHRLIIVAGNPEEKSYEAALKKLAEAKAELDERDVVIKTEKSETFSIRLIGKDGGEKCAGDSNFTVKEITKKIDQMPMRLDEMRKHRVFGR